MRPMKAQKSNDALGILAFFIIAFICMCDFDRLTATGLCLWLGLPLLSLSIISFIIIIKTKTSK